MKSSFTTYNLNYHNPSKFKRNTHFKHKTQLFEKEFNLFNQKYQEIDPLLSPSLVKKHRPNRNEKSKKLSCINLGFDDQDIQQEKVKIPLNCTSNETFGKTLFTSNQKRHHQKLTKVNKRKTMTIHRFSSDNLTRFNLIQPDQQKKKLISFQKKLLNILEQKKYSKNLISNKQNLSLRFLCSKKQQQVSQLQRQLNSSKNLRYHSINQSVDSLNLQSLNLSNLKQNSLRVGSNVEVQTERNNVRKLDKSGFKHLGQFDFSMNNGQKSQLFGSNFALKSLLQSNYQRTLLLKQKCKFRKIDLNILRKGKLSEFQNRMILDSNDDRPSNKLRNLLRKTRATVNVKPSNFTPWQSNLSEKSIVLD